MTRVKHPFLKTEATCDAVSPTTMTTTATETFRREVEVIAKLDSHLPFQFLIDFYPF